MIPDPETDLPHLPRNAPSRRYPLLAAWMNPSYCRGYMKTSTVWRGLMLAQAIGMGACGDAAAPVPLFDLPTVVNHGGPILAAARVQPIYFSGFRYPNEVDEFIRRLPTSAYWQQIGAEYGLGPPTALPGVASTAELPPTVGSEDMAALLAAELAPGSRAGTARGDTIYVLLFSSSTAVSVSGGRLCDDQGFLAYHAEASISGTPVAMVVATDCDASDPSGLSGPGLVTAALSHELVEAATDPLADSAPAYSDVDPDHAMWSAAIDGGELADLCENEWPNLIVPEDLGYPVQRIWSNAGAKAGTGPCMPVPPGEVYFVAVPRLPKEAAVSGSPALTVPAVSASTGTAATVDVDFLSQPDPPPSWEAVGIEYHGAAEPAGGQRPAPVSGSAGQSRQLSVTATEPRAGTFPLIILSHSPSGDLHLWVGAIVRH
jgi:hypothetical protein